MHQDEIEIQKFRWERQKWLLTISVATTALTMATMLFYVQLRERREVERYTNEAVERALEESIDLKKEMLILRERTAVLESKLSDARSLIESISENQKAQQDFIDQVFSKEKDG